MAENRVPLKGNGILLPDGTVKMFDDSLADAHKRADLDQKRANVEATKTADFEKKVALGLEKMPKASLLERVGGLVKTKLGVGAVAVGVLAAVAGSDVYHALSSSAKRIGESAQTGATVAEVQKSLVQGNGSGESPESLKINPDGTVGAPAAVGERMAGVDLGMYGEAFQGLRTSVASYAVKKGLPQEQRVCLTDALNLAVRRAADVAPLSGSQGHKNLDAFGKRFADFGTAQMEICEKTGMPAEVTKGMSRAVFSEAKDSDPKNPNFMKQLLDASPKV